MTSPRQVKFARDIAGILAHELPGRCRVTVDDWSDYGSFSILVHPEGRTVHTGCFLPGLETLEDGARHTLISDISRRIRAVIRRNIKLVEHTRELDIETPRMLYDRWSSGGRRHQSVKGYERNYIKVTLRVVNLEDETS